MGLKEKMAASRAAKEQKLAERQVASAGKTAETIVDNLRKDRSQINLLLIEKVAGVISDAQSKEDNEVMNKLLDSAKHKLMYKAVEEYLSGDWMLDFKKLLKAVPGTFLRQAQVIKVDQWREYAVKAGIDEVGLVQALQVIFIFRKSFDRNQVSKPKGARG
jgi:hypothetical protein